MERENHQIGSTDLRARNAAYAQYNSTGRTFQPKDISVSDYLDYWLQNAIMANLGQGYTYNTYKDYEAKIRIHLKPAFSQYCLSSLFQCRADQSVPYKEIWPLSVKENGELLTPEAFKYCARVVHHELGNPLFHSHCLRHTHGTILAEQGVNPKTIMERLGHRDIKTRCRSTHSTQSPCNRQLLMYLNPQSTIE